VPGMLGVPHERQVRVEDEAEVADGHVPEARKGGNGGNGLGAGIGILGLGFWDWDKERGWRTPS
jgi:hypothetical protein